MSKLITELIRKTQYEYKDLLSNLLPILKEETSFSALDEIVLFWKKRINEVMLFLKSEAFFSDTYVYTGDVKLDVMSKKHYPFWIAGDLHLYDDPLCSYAEICKKLPEEKISKELLKTIVFSIEKTIQVIDKHSENIFVLPFRMTSQVSDNTLILDAGERAFLSLFKDINSIEEYIDVCNSIDDIVEHGISDIEKIVLFYDYEDRTVDFKIRFEHAKHKYSKIIKEDDSDALIFAKIILSLLQQSTDIFVSCIEYNCSPYLQYPTTFSYFNMIAANFIDDPNIKNILFKATIAHLISQHADVDKISHLEVEKLHQVLKEDDFNNKLYSKLSPLNTEYSMWSIKEMSDLVKAALSNLYDKLPNY